jgi:hypothetical protein
VSLVLRAWLWVLICTDGISWELASIATAWLLAVSTSKRDNEDSQNDALECIVMAVLLESLA